MRHGTYRWVMAHIWVSHVIHVRAYQIGSRDYVSVASKKKENKNYIRSWRMWCVRKIGSPCTCEHIATYCITLKYTEAHLHACAWRFLCFMKHTHACVWSENSLKTTLCCSREMCCSVLQCVAVCYSVLQCVAVCCSVLQRVAVCCSAIQERCSPSHENRSRTQTHVRTYCTKLQYTAAHCSTPPCMRVAWDILVREANIFQDDCVSFMRATWNMTSWETATHCNKLQHTATPRSHTPRSCGEFAHLFIRTRMFFVRAAISNEYLMNVVCVMKANIYIDLLKTTNSIAYTSRTLDSSAHACFMCVKL